MIDSHLISRYDFEQINFHNDQFNRFPISFENYINYTEIQRKPFTNAEENERTEYTKEILQKRIKM